MPPAQVRAMPNRDVMDLLAMFRLEAERASRPPSKLK
jgi:hypothetical protein